MNPRRGIQSILLAACAGSVAVTASGAPPGVTEKMGTTRSTPVPAPLPQAVPAGQGVRPSGVPRPSVALPAPAETPEAAIAPMAPALPSVASTRAPLPSLSLSKPGVEVAPVAPSLAAHGVPVGMAMAPPAAGTDAGPVAAAAPSAQAPKTVVKPKGHGTLKAAARAPADGEPRLRPEPGRKAHKQDAPAGKPTASTTASKATKRHAGAAKVVAPKAVKPASTRAPKTRKAGATAAPPPRRVNDGSRP